MYTNITLLKQAVEQQFGQPLQTTQDCRLLSDAIYKTTQEDLSYNTLRRMFKIVKTNKQTNKHILELAL